jgi:hypothetical protein
MCCAVVAGVCVLGMGCVRNAGARSVSIVAFSRRGW